MPLAEANMFTVMLVQALWGAISSNFRSVSLSMQSLPWVVHFTLEREDKRDRLEIGEVIDEFVSLLEGYAPHGTSVEALVTVSSGPLPMPNHNESRLVFLRRERL